MPQTKAKAGQPQRPAARSRTDRFDLIVADALRKSTVVAPSDPTGGQKLPQRQENAAARKRKGKEQYAAIFDREAQKSNDQLDEEEDETNDTTESPEDFVNDDDDTPEDPDDESMDDNRGEVYDPYSDDDEDDDEDEPTIAVKAHRRRRKMAKANVAHDRDNEDVNLSDDDDLDEDDEDEDEEDEEPKGKRKPKAEEPKEMRRREVRKSMGSDYLGAYDGVPVLKSLTDGLFDKFAESAEANRLLRREVRQLRREVAELGARNARDQEAMTKALASGYAQAAAPYQVPDGGADALRKGMVAQGDPRTTGKHFEGEDRFNLSKALDVLDDAVQRGDITSAEATVLEIRKRPEFLSPRAQQLLRKERLI